MNSYDMRWLIMKYFAWIYLVCLSIHLVVCRVDRNNATKSIVTHDGGVFDVRDIVSQQQINDVSAEYLVNDKRRIDRPTGETFFPGLTQQIFKDLDDENQQLARTDIPVNPDEQYIIPDINLVDSEDALSAVERVYGYFKPPMNGPYVFKISSKGESTLSMSTSSDKNYMKKYADVEAGQVVDRRQYDKYENQKSHPIQLIANQKYYMEVIHKRMDGASHLQIGALFPDGQKHFPLESKFFYTVKDAKEDVTPVISNAPQALVNPHPTTRTHGSHVRQLSHPANKIDPRQCAPNLRIRLYSSNFNCPKRKGHICKYALSGEGTVVKLRPREAATTFVITKPGLNNYANSLSFQVDGKHGVFLVKENDKYVVAPNDGSKRFASLSSFNIDSQDDIAPSSYGIRLFQTRVSYLCHGPSSTEVYNDKRSPNCAFYMVPVELDMNEYEPSCTNYCPQDDSNERPAQSNWNDDRVPDVLKALAHHAADVEAAKYAGKLNLISPLTKNPTNYTPVDMEAEKSLHAKDIAPINLDDVKIRPVNKLTPVNLDKLRPAIVQLRPMNDTESQPLVLVKNALTEKQVPMNNIPQQSDIVSPVASLLQSNNLGQSMMVNSSLNDEQVQGRQQYIALHLNNNVGTVGDIRIVSSIKPEGYVLGREVFKLKILFKHRYEKSVVFYGEDESGLGRIILLNGQREMRFYPTADDDQSTEVSVTAVDPVIEIHPDPSATELPKAAPPVKQPKPERPIEPVSEGPKPVQISKKPQQSERPKKAPKPPDDKAMPPHNGHITSISGVARAPGSASPPVKVNNAVDESIDFPAMIEKKQYHRPAPTVDENAEQKDGVPDVLEIAYDEDNAEKKTITELHVGNNIAHTRTFNSTNDFVDLHQSDNVTTTLPPTNATSYNTSLSEKHFLNGDNKTFEINNTTITELKQTNQTADGGKVNHMEIETDKSANLIVTHPNNESENRSESGSQFQNERKSQFQNETEGLSLIANQSQFLNESQMQNMSPSDVHYDYVDVIDSNNDTAINSSIVNMQFNATTEDRRKDETSSVVNNSTGARNETYGVSNVAANAETSDEDSYSVIKSLDETQKELRELNTQIEKLDKESNLLKLQGNSEETQTYGDSLEKSNKQENSPGLEKVKQYEQSVSSESSKKDIESIETAAAHPLPEEEIGGRSEKKTITAVPLKTGVKPVVEDGDTVVEKKNVLNTLKALEENNYRTKVKSLSNFLNEYTNEDLNQKRRYKAWLSEHQHPNSWYYGVPVSGVKRSPFSRKSSYFQSPASPTDPVVIHDDDASYRRYDVHPKITFPRQIQFHDDKKRAKIPMKPPKHQHKQRVNKHRRNRRSLCNCAFSCAGDDYMEKCLTHCESECSSLAVHENENTRGKRGLKDVESETSNKKNTVFDGNIVNDNEGETAFDFDEGHKNINRRKSYVAEEDEEGTKLDTHVKIHQKKVKKMVVTPKKSVIPAAQRRYGYRQYSYNSKNILPLKRTFVGRPVYVPVRKSPIASTYKTNIQQSYNVFRNRLPPNYQNQQQTQYYISPRYYTKSYVPQQSRYQSFQRWYQPKTSGRNQASYYYNKMYPTQSQYYARNMIPASSPYNNPYLNYARYYAQSQQKTKYPLFYARNGVPAKPADVKAKIPAHKIYSRKRIVNPVKYIHDEDTKEKKYKVVTGAKRMLVYPNKSVRKPATTVRGVVKTIAVMSQSPAHHQNVTSDENKIFKGNVVTNKNRTQTGSMAESLQGKKSGSDRSANGKSNQPNAERGNKDMNNNKAAKFSMLPKSRIPYYVKKVNTESGSKRDTNSTLENVADNHNKFLNDSLSNETIVDLKNTFEKYLNKEDGNITVDNTTVGNVTSNESLRKDNNTKTGDGKSRIINKIMNEEKKGDEGDGKRRNSYFAIEIAEDEDEPKLEPTAKGAAKKKTSDLETAKKEIESEVKAKESLTDKNGGIENVIFDNNVDVSSVFFRHDAKLNRKHEQNATEILKDIDAIQPAKGKDYVNHTDDVSFSDAVFPTQALQHVETHHGNQDDVTKPYIAVDSPNKAYVKAETVSKAFLHHEQPTKLFSLDAPTLKLTNNVFHNDDKPTEAFHKIKKPTAFSHEVENPTQSLHKVENPTQSLHKVENPTQSLHKVENPTQSFHKVENPTQSLHKVEKPTQTLHKVDNLAQSFHEVENPTKFFQKVDNSSQSVHKIENPTQTVHIVKSPTVAAHKVENSALSLHEIGSPTEAVHKINNPTMLFHGVERPTMSSNNFIKSSKEFSGIDKISETSPNVEKSTESFRKLKPTEEGARNADSLSAAAVRDTNSNKAMKGSAKIVNVTKIEEFLHNKTSVFNGTKSIKVNDTAHNITTDQVQPKPTIEKQVLKLKTPKEIEAVYTDRIDDREAQRTGQINYDETETNMPFKAYAGHDNVNGDWFDSGFQPDTKTKQDIRMSKSGFLNKLMLKEKVNLIKSKGYNVSPTNRQVEDKIKNIVNAAEITEQSELQKLIKESIGTALTEEQAALNPLNLKNAYRNMSDLASQDGEPEDIKPAKENGEMNRIMSDFKDELALNEADSNSPMIEDATGKNDLMKELKVNDQQEFNALKSDLEGSFNQRGGVHRMRNFTDIQDIEDENGEKKQLHKYRDSDKKRHDFKVRESTDGLDSGKLSAKSATTKPDDDMKSTLVNENSLSLSTSSDELKETSAPVFPTPKEKNYRKYQMETNKMKPSLEGIEEKWEKVKEQNKHIADEEDERINEEILSRKHQTKTDDDDDDKEDTKEYKNGDLLNKYFKEVEGTNKLSEGKELNLRQEKRQKKIKATLAMINDIESQIDGMIHATDKSEHKKAKKRGKAAIFSELVGKHSNANYEKTEAEEANDIKNYGSGDMRHVSTHKIVKGRKVSRGKSAKKKTGNKHQKKEGLVEKEEEELEDADDEDDEDDEEKVPPKRKHTTPKTEDEDEYDDEMNNDHFDVPHKTLRKIKHRFEEPSPQQRDENSIANVIATSDRRVRAQQASELLNLQKQEVNEDLLKLKEVTQDGLQSMFAKAVAKQQKFMDDVQGPTEEQGEDLTQRDQLQENPYNEKQLVSFIGDQTLPYQNDQNELGNNFNPDFVNDEDIPSNRKSDVEREREDFDDDLLEPESENADDSNEDNDMYDDDRRRRTVN